MSGSAGGSAARACIIDTHMHMHMQLSVHVVETHRANRERLHGIF